MSERIIEKNIPIPTNRRGRAKTSIFRLMEVGDSVFMEGISTSSSCAHFSYVSAKTGRKFTSRAVTENGIEGARVWRVS